MTIEGSIMFKSISETFLVVKRIISTAKKLNYFAKDKHEELWSFEDGKYFHS